MKFNFFTKSSIVCMAKGSLQKTVLALSIVILSLATVACGSGGGGSGGSSKGDGPNNGPIPPPGGSSGGKIIITNNANVDFTNYKCSLSIGNDAYEIDLKFKDEVKSGAVVTLSSDLAPTIFSKINALGDNIDVYMYCGEYTDSGKTTYYYSSIKHNLNDLHFTVTANSNEYAGNTVAVNTVAGSKYSYSINANGTTTAKCDIVLNTDKYSITSFLPTVTTGTLNNKVEAILDITPHSTAMEFVECFDGQNNFNSHSDEQATFNNAMTFTLIALPTTP